MHKFINVFSGTPSEVTTAPYPIPVSGEGQQLSNPAWDVGLGLILVGDLHANGGTNSGEVHPANVSTGVVGSSPVLCLGLGYEGSVVLDPSAGKVYFACAEDEIANITSELTMVGGKIVYGAGDFAALDQAEVPPAMPDWSPVRRFGGYAAWADSSATARDQDRKLAMSCGCADACTIHGHNHARAWSGRLPIADLRSFWGVLGCACWAV